MLDEIPWDYENDHMVRSPGSSPYCTLKGQEPKYRMRPVFTFRATLKIDTMYWSRSSCVIWKDESGHESYMFLKDFEDGILGGMSIVDAKATGTWTFVRRGTKYGIRWVKDE